MPIDPPKMERIEFLGCPMDVASMADTLRIIGDKVEAGQFTQHVVVNVAKIVAMQSNPELRASVVNSDIINIDGMGVVLGARFLGYKIPERVTGIDLFYRLVELASRRGFPIFLLGARAEIVERVEKRLRELHPSLVVAGHHHGYFRDDEAVVVEKIKLSGARLLFVAMTSPKKENFIHAWKDDLGVDFVMGVGGTFDVVAGEVKRAPPWMQRHGLEWFYRVLQEPGRLWKRYLTSNTKFAMMLVREKLKSSGRHGARL